MKVVVIANDDDPWTASRLVRLFNNLSKKAVGYDSLFKSEEEARATNEFAHGAPLPSSARAITFTITSSEDEQ